MTDMKTSRIAICAFFATMLGALATPKTAPAWLRYTEASVLVGLILMGVLTVVIAVIRTRAYRSAVREVPASNGIQVLDTMLNDEGGSR